MRKYKVCVYGVCKNEEKFVRRCMESIKDADTIVMVDTGSTDKTIEILEDCGAQVYSVPVNPWRFDVARNACLDYIPEDVDICVCIDLDEVLEEGWRESLEKVWEEDTKRASYLYIWSFNQDGTPGGQYYHERIHARHQYKWIYPTHEVLEYLGEGKEKWCYPEGVVFKHYPDRTKSRSFNLELLKLAVEENPESTRNMHYLGREYYFAGLWEKCIETLKIYLDMPNATWREERSFAMRYIANCYTVQGEILEAKAWLLVAIAEAPEMREAYIEMARLAYRQKEWRVICWMCESALKITQPSKRHYNEAFAWNETVYDLISLGYYYTGQHIQALSYCEEAAKRAPEDTRIQENVELIRRNVKRIN